MNDSFEQFVKQQVEFANAFRGRLDVAREIAIWLDKLDALYALVQESLARYIADGSIGVAFTDVSLTEAWLGTYTAREMHLTIGRQAAHLKPKGTLFTSARGRVDLNGPRGITHLTLVPPDATRPRLRVSLAVPDEPASGSEDFPSPETWVWKIATPAPRIAYIDLTSETFRDCLMGVVSG